MEHVSGVYSIKAVKFATWGGDKAAFLDIFKEGTIPLLLITFVILLVLFGIGTALQNRSIKKFIPAFTGLFVITTIVRIISAQVLFNRYLEYAFWALLIGIVIANTIKTPKRLKPALQTEFYIKAGLVTFGAEVLFSNIKKVWIIWLGNSMDCNTYCNNFHVAFRHKNS